MVIFYSYVNLPEANPEFCYSHVDPYISPRNLEENHANLSSFSDDHRDVPPGDWFEDKHCRIPVPSFVEFLHFFNANIYIILIIYLINNYN